jgi:hypothetical protein
VINLTGADGKLHRKCPVVTLHGNNTTICREITGLIEIVFDIDIAKDEVSVEIGAGVTGIAAGATDNGVFKG